MNLLQIVVTAVLTTLSVLILGGIGVWSLLPYAAEATPVASHGFASSPSERHCDRMDDSHIEIGQAVAAAVLDLNDTQETALQAVADTATRWHNVARDICQTADFASLEASLDTAEVILAQSNAAFGELKPLLVDFLATLDDEQRQKLEAHLHNHREHGRHGSKGRRGHHRWGH